MTVPACFVTTQMTAHAIVCSDGYGDDLGITFFLKGVTAYLSVKPLTLEEYEAHESQRVELTSQRLTLKPHSSIFEDQENSMVDHHGSIVQSRSKKRRPLMIIVFFSLLPPALMQC